MSSEFEGKTLALLLMAKTEEGDDDWAVFPGTFRKDGDRAYLERDDGHEDFEIREEWVERIRPVDNEEVRSILQNCDFFLSLSVGSIADSERESLDTTGLKWPQEDNG